jgi:hypothetical protein
VIHEWSLSAVHSRYYASACVPYCLNDGGVSMLAVQQPFNTPVTCFVLNGEIKIKVKQTGA